MKYKLLDDSNPTYLVVEQNDEAIVLHPSTEEHREVKDGIVTLEDDHWTLKKNTHAIRCGCNKCRGLMSDLMGMVKESGAKIIDSRDKNAIKKAFKDIKDK